MTRTLDRHPEGRGRNLRDHRLGPLALLGDAGLADDRALRVEPMVTPSWAEIFAPLSRKTPRSDWSSR